LVKGNCEKSEKTKVMMPGAQVETGAAAIARVHYAVEYTDNRGRRRRARRSTLTGAERFKNGLRLGSEAIIRLIVRQVSR
jgi:hypothetical protein